MNSKLLHSGNIIIAGFGLMIIFMSYLVIRCINQPAEMVNDNYYENELKYQDNIIAKSNGDEFASEYSVRVNANKISLNVPPNLASEFTKGSVNFYCISDKNFDKKINIENSKFGVYEFDCTGWKKVSYMVKIAIEANGKTYYHEIPLQL